METNFIRYRKLIEIGMSKQNSREIINEVNSFTGYMHLNYLILDKYINLINKDNQTKERIKSDLEEIFID